MALTVTTGKNPIKCTGTTAVDQEVYGYQVFIRFIYWYNPTTIGHLLSLVDDNGNPIIPARCEVANQSQILPVYTKVNAIHCDDMDSGTLYIYIS